MNTQLLKRLYSIYSPSGKEQKMMTFLCSYIKKLPGNISVSKDKFGNLYVIKGKAETYPLAVLKGNLAPDGSVVKRSAVVDEMMVHEGPARVFECEEDAIAAIKGGNLSKRLY